jgi:hypothetical protein
MRSISTLPSLLALSFFLCACQPLAAAPAHGEDILIADFEEGFGQWQVEGDAFGDGPVFQRLPQQKHVWGYLGGTYANSYHGGDDSTGKLTSPPFTLERRYINCLITGELFDIEAEFEAGDADEFGFKLNGVTLAYDVDDKKLSCEGWDAKLEPIDGKIRMRTLVDRLSLETFANDGRVYMPIGATPVENQNGIEVFTRGGNTNISSLTVNELKSIWN